MQRVIVKGKCCEKSLFYLKCREAWSKLGDISKEEAMESYVNELKEVKDAS